MTRTKHTPFMMFKAKNLNSTSTIESSIKFARLLPSSPKAHYNGWMEWHHSTTNVIIISSKHKLTQLGEESS